MTANFRAGMMHEELSGGTRWYTQAVDPILGVGANFTLIKNAIPSRLESLDCIDRSYE